MGRQPKTDAEVDRVMVLRNQAIARCGFGMRADDAWVTAKDWGYVYEEFVASSYPCLGCPFYMTCVLEQRPVNESLEDSA